MLIKWKGFPLPFCDANLISCASSFFTYIDAYVCILTLNRQTIPCNWHIDKPWQHLPLYWNHVSVLSAPTQKLGQNSYVTLFWAVPLLFWESRALGTINGTAPVLHQEMKQAPRHRTPRESLSLWRRAFARSVWHRLPYIGSKPTFYAVKPLLSGHFWDLVYRCPLNRGWHSRGCAWGYKFFYRLSSVLL